MCIVKLKMYCFIFTSSYNEFKDFSAKLFLTVDIYEDFMLSKRFGLRLKCC